jgi:3-hydroxyisobutyrate dehydrogenase-like beta-hydroxyacid dehydrogenase
MGLAMANNLQRHLAAKKALSLLYTNRTMARGQPLQSIGGIAVPGFNDLVAHSKIIFTMVWDTVPPPYCQARWLARYSS